MKMAKIRENLANFPRHGGIFCSIFSHWPYLALNIV